MSQEYSRPFFQMPQSPYFEGMSAFRAATSSSQWLSGTAPAKAVTHLYHMGVCPENATQCTILLQTYNAGVGITAAGGWGEAGIFKGFFPLTLTASSSLTTTQFEELPTLTMVGTVNLMNTLTTGGIYQFSCSFTGSSCVLGEEMWFALGFSGATLPNLYSNCGPDFLQSGRYLTVAGRPSSLTSVGPSNLAWGSTSTYIPAFSVMLDP